MRKKILFECVQSMSTTLNYKVLDIQDIVVDLDLDLIRFSVVVKPDYTSFNEIRPNHTLNMSTYLKYKETFYGRV